MDDNYNKMREMTTSGEIAYARGELKAPGPAAKELLKDRSTRFNKETERKMLRSAEVKEQHEAKGSKLRLNIMRNIDGIIGTSKLGVERFQQVFRDNGVKHLVGTTKSLINFHSIPEDFAKLEKALPEEVGDLELISSSLKNKRTVKNYDPFSEYDNLFVARMRVDLSGVPVIYEGVIGTDYSVTENLYVGDEDKADDIADETGVKNVNKVLFPIGGIFDTDFFYTVKDLILTDREEEKEK